MVNVIDGRADIQIDTSNIQEGEYKIQTMYTDGNYYTDTSVENSTLTLEPIQTITDDCTTTTNWYPSRLGLPTVTTYDGYTCLNGVQNTNEHSIHKQMCVYRYAKSTLEFDINLRTRYGIFGLASLKLINADKRLNNNVLQYVPAWNHYNQSSSSGSITSGQWHHIKWETENETTKCYTDNNLAFTYNWEEYSTETEFNDYLFLFLQNIYSSDKVYMKNISLTSDHIVRGSELDSVLAKYESQYNGGGVTSNLLFYANTTRGVVS